MANQATTDDPYSRIGGTYTNPKTLNEMLRWVQQNAFLIAPAAACSQLPPGCAVALTTVWFNPDTDAHSVGGSKLSLLKHALEQLAVAAGVAFDPDRSGRVDDGSDPHYCHWRAVGAWRHLDGSILPIIGDKEIDLRNGSSQVDSIMADARGSNDAERADRGKKNVLAIRALIAAHAQTKAELRAIRKSLSIRTYTAQELLGRPFVAAKLMYLGHSTDPQIARENAAAIRTQMLGGALALFGPPPQAQQQAAQQYVPMLPPVRLAPQLTPHAPPPVGTVADAYADDEGSGPLPFAGEAPAQPAPVPTAPTPQPARQAAPQAASGGRSGVIMKFGRAKDTAIEDAADRDLEWYGDAVEKSANDPAKSRFRDSNLADLAAIRAEQAKRGGGGGSAPQRAPAPPPPTGGDDFGGSYGSDDEIPF